MFRLFALLALLPTVAAADWVPRPSMFTYNATYFGCTDDPVAPDLARDCKDALDAAYALKRAVALATFECGDRDLATCSAPFENEGLPAIAMQIAVNAGCDATDVLTLPEDEPIPANHCIALASDIMIDEGVLPVFTEIGCGVIWIECGELAQIHAQLWEDAVYAAIPGDPSNLIALRQEEARAACAQTAGLGGGWGEDLERLDCEARKNAALWADIMLPTTQDQ